ncbi:peptidoglycan DD-metalloendopeptidase family protein [Vibrio owensii]|uniref:peptidoglycan DD-metalloendopeptidase family protein n=1 Tax=Vibrio owensii TaxID=696485 RepID=UPI0018F21044|nr:peptidoglycan DD-metalloendopeptidase family protein [Vibrio owensii]
MKSLNLRRFLLSKRQAALLYSLPVIASSLVFMNIPDKPETKSVLLNLPSNEAIRSLTTPIASDLMTPPSYEYTIAKGDNLSSIFSRLNLNYSDLLSILKTDADYLALDTLKAGNKLIFWQDLETDQLNKLEIHFSPADKVSYELTDNGDYEHKDISVPGVWHNSIVAGEIKGSFSRSAKKMGLSPSETAAIASLLKDKINFARDLKAGDSFEVMRRIQSVDNSPTGKSEIRAVRIINQKREISAYIHTDGQYYNQDGKSLERAFLRYPVDRKFRVSSHFNPRRKHPVTGKVKPHNGTDWATPIGTPVIAAGDGSVVMVRNHPYAGKYVVIKHGSKYKTRYLHLHKILVKKGQKVARGQRIGLTGKTGRVTGAHLHYELIRYGRPVNPLKADIPMAKSVPKKEMDSFVRTRNEINKALEEHNKAQI